MQAKAVIAAFILARLPQQHTRTERHSQGILTAGQRQRGYRLVEKPGLHATVGGLEAMNQEAVDVGPVERLLLGMPYGTLSAPVPRRRHANRLAYRRIRHFGLVGALY